MVQRRTYVSYPLRLVSPPQVIVSVGDNLPAADCVMAHERSVRAIVKNFMIAKRMRLKRQVVTTDWSEAWHTRANYNRVHTTQRRSPLRARRWRNERWHYRYKKERQNPCSKLGRDREPISGTGKGRDGGLHYWKMHAGSMQEQTSDVVRL